VTAEQLQFWADDSFAGQKSDDLMPKQMRIDPFFDPSGCGVLVDDLSDATSARDGEKIR
jgi:hypothetical protein